MTREQLVRRLEQRARRRGPALYVWWNGELIDVGRAMGRAVALGPDVQVHADGDDVIVPTGLRDAGASLPRAA